jgi:hypothetical protein
MEAFSVLRVLSFGPCRCPHCRTPQAALASATLRCPKCSFLFDRPPLRLKLLLTSDGSRACECVVAPPALNAIVGNNFLSDFRELCTLLSMPEADCFAVVAEELRAALEGHVRGRIGGGADARSLSSRPRRARRSARLSR